MILPDSSVWIGYLRGRQGVRSRLDDPLKRATVAICGVVLAELLIGRSGSRDIAEAFSGLTYRPDDRSTWELAGRLGSAARKRGRRMEVPDLMIAAVALEQGDEIWTLDRDFAVIQELEPDLDVVFLDRDAGR